MNLTEETACPERNLPEGSLSVKRPRLQENQQDGPQKCEGEGNAV